MASNPLDDPNKNAEILYLKAEKKLTSWWGSKTDNYQDAAELFEKSANLYKIAKNMDKAAEAYIRASDCIKVESPWEASSKLIAAANCYKHNSPQNAKITFRKAANYCLEEGKFQQAAKLIIEIAEIYEKEFMIMDAIESYREAADLYKTESATFLEQKCLVKAADYMSTKSIGLYSDAITIWENASSVSVDNSSLTFMSKEYLFKAALCRFATGDYVASARALKNYEEQNVSFAASRECQFLTEILNAIETYDLDYFTKAVVEYDSITPLKPWYTEILLTIKKTIETVPDEKDEDNLT